MLPASRFRQLRANWLDILGGKHANSASNQLYQACGDAAFFTTVRELGRTGEATHSVNGRLLQMFHLGYAVRQSLAIRRLVDGRTDVKSIRRVVESMISHRELLTREHVVSHDGCPFDTVAAKDAYVTSIDWEAAKDGAVNSGDPNLLRRYSDSDSRHRAFDRISDLGAAGRTVRDDQISAIVLERMRAALTSDSIKRVKGFVNKFVAHADQKADPKSPDLSPTYADIELALKTLAQVHAFLTGNVLYASSTTLVPIPQFDHLKDLDQPLIAPAEIARARRVWQEKTAEINQWTQAAEADEQFCIHPMTA